MKAVRRLLESAVQNRSDRREGERLRWRLDKVLLSSIELASELRLLNVESMLVLLDVSQNVILLGLRELASLDRSLKNKKTE